MGVTCSRNSLYFGVWFCKKTLLLIVSGEGMGQCNFARLVTGLGRFAVRLLTWLALVTSFGVLQQRRMFLLQLAKTFSTLMAELLLLSVQGVDLKHQPALPGRIYKSKQLNMGTSPLYRQGTSIHGCAGTVPLLPSRAFLWVTALLRWVWTPGLRVCHGDLLRDLPMSKQISGGKQGAELRFPMSLSNALVSDHLILCSERVVWIPSLLFFLPLQILSY